jgi:hypothetical protein
MKIDEDSAHGFAEFFSKARVNAEPFVDRQRLDCQLSISYLNRLLLIAHCLLSHRLSQCDKNFFLEKLSSMQQNSKTRVFRIKT